MLFFSSNRGDAFVTIEKEKNELATLSEQLYGEL